MERQLGSPWGIQLGSKCMGVRALREMGSSQEVRRESQHGSLLGGLGCGQKAELSGKNTARSSPQWSSADLHQIPLYLMSPGAYIAFKGVANDLGGLCKPLFYMIACFPSPLLSAPNMYEFSAYSFKDFLHGFKLSET